MTSSRFDSARAARTREFAITLTRWPSVTGSEGEATFPERLRELLATWPYFQRHPAQVWVTPARSYASGNVYALVRGRGPQTVVLSGHFDTVHTDSYGDEQAWATDPEALTERLIASLQRPGLTASEELALQDLSSGEFLPGRGLLDMKGGIAAGMTVLERYAALPESERPGNLLLVATPDEEGMSRGARSAVSDLPEIAARFQLEVRLGINLDATSDVGDGSEGRAVYLGTVGKLLLSALIVGRPTHAAYPFDGSSAALMAAELVRAVEGNPELADTAYGQNAAPPVCLELRDSRTQYDVTTPAQLWCAFNVLTQRSTPPQVFSRFLELAQTAAQTALTLQAQQAAAWGSVAAPALAELRAQVLSFAELRAQAAAHAGEVAVQAVIAATPADPDPLQASRSITQALVGLARLEGPAIIVGLGAVHYPHTHVADSGADAQLAERLSRQVERFSQLSGQSVRVRHSFAGISDMSFLGHVPGAADAELVFQQTPHPVHVHTTPQGALHFPTINVGPWGRDYHQKLERLHQGYGFGVLPELVWELAVSELESREEAPFGERADFAVPSDTSLGER